MMPRMGSGLKVEAKMELSSKCWDINRFVMMLRVQVILWMECIIERIIRIIDSANDRNTIGDALYQHKWQ